MSILNCTPHVIHIHTSAGIRTFERAGPVPRVSSVRSIVATVDGIEIDTVAFGEVIDLPPPVVGTFLVVSSLVAQAAKGRPDLLVPGEAVRQDGVITGCKGLSTLQS